MKGLRAAAAKTILALVAALAGSAWSMILPKGKLVPYKHATAASKRRGPRYEFITLSTTMPMPLFDEARDASSSSDSRLTASIALVELAKDFDENVSVSTIFDRGNSVRVLLVSIPPSFCGEYANDVEVEGEDHCDILRTAMNPSEDALSIANNKSLLQ